MTFFELLAVVISLMIGVQVGELLSKSIGIWGWIIGIPAGFVVVNFAFRFLAKLSDRWRKK